MVKFKLQIFLKVGMGMNASHSIKNYGIINNTSNSTYKDSYGYAVAKMPFAPAYDEEGKPLNVDGVRHSIIRCWMYIRQRMKLVIIVLCLILMEKLILVKSGRQLKG